MVDSLKLPFGLDRDTNKNELRFIEHLLFARRCGKHVPRSILLGPHSSSVDTDDVIILFYRREYTVSYSRGKCLCLVTQPCMVGLEFEPRTACSQARVLQHHAPHPLDCLSFCPSSLRVVVAFCFSCLWLRYCPLHTCGQRSTAGVPSSLN